MAPYNLDKHDNLGNLLRRDAAAAAGPTNPSLYLGLGIGVGGALLLAIIIVVVQIVKKHREHKRLIDVLEVEEAVQLARRQEVGEVSRPSSALRRTSLSNPLQIRAGWGALSSNDTIDEDPRSASRREKRKRSSVSLPKRIKPKGIPLKRWKRLTAILESPRSWSANSPAIPVELHVHPDSIVAVPPTPVTLGLKAYTMRKVSDDVFLRPDSPKPEVLPSFAIRSPGRYGANIASNDINVKASRSRSVGALGAPVMDRQVVEGAPDFVRPSMHMRSISLGAPPSLPPSCPVPPLPVIEPQTNHVDPLARQGLHISRLSSSSQDSEGSSVLISSPILTMHGQSQPLSSPTVAQVVADDDSASLKSVTTRQWQKPLAKPGRLPSHLGSSKSQMSIRSNMATYSVESLASHRLSSASLNSSEEKNRMSTMETGLAERVTLSRVSSSNSITSSTGVQKLMTPRKHKRSSVSASGSPAERRKTSILRDISGNLLLGPSRQGSIATQDSGRSSNGNPFQWDQPMPKPSALKGSPNARKGHRRQNCVRISTLTPQILGPPPSRSMSPNIMHGIEEESGDDQEALDSTRLRFVTNQRLSRPPSTASFAPNLRIQTLRASLTPSSPTLSAWNAFQEHGLPSLPSDSHLSASPTTRPCSRQSDRSSPFTIPSFPSPSKATLTEIQLSQPVPQFCLSRPSSERNHDDEDEETSSPPFGLQLSSDHSLPSSPPDIMARDVSYDPAHPAWSTVTLEVPMQTEYDPASPSWLDAVEPERSSGLFPFAAASVNINEDNHQEVFQHASPNAYGGELPDTPPCSPKSMPAGFQAFFRKGTSASKSQIWSEQDDEELTSSNASTIMARLPSRTVDFPGAPVLAPHSAPAHYSQTTLERPLPLTTGRSRGLSTAMPQHTPWAPPLHSGQPDTMPTIPSSDLYTEVDLSDCDIPIPSPLALPSKSNIKPPSLLNGPRLQPSPSVQKTADALRRMNSEANASLLPPSTSTASLMDPEETRGSRMYVRMGREASPLLPWISGGESDGAGAFDFGFGGDTDAGTGAGEDGEEGWRSALDEIDLGVVERKLEGALAGFEAESTENKENEGDDRWKEDVKRTAWEDGENFWEGKEWSGFGAKSARMGDLATPQKGRPKSIQMTPRSLYDSDGLLKT